MVSSKKTTIILIFVLLYVTCSFSLAAFPVFSITAVVQFDYDVLGVVFFHVSFAGTVYLQVYGFHQIWKSYGYYLFLSLPSSHCPRTPMTCLLGRLMLSYIILMLHLGEVFFSCSILSSFHGCVLKFINLFS